MGLPAASPAGLRCSEDGGAGAAEPLGPAASHGSWHRSLGATCSCPVLGHPESPQEPPGLLLPRGALRTGRGRSQPSGWDSSREGCSVSGEISSATINSLSRKPTVLCWKGRKRGGLFDQTRLCRRLDTVNYFLLVYGYRPRREAEGTLAPSPTAWGGQRRGQGREPSRPPLSWEESDQPPARGFREGTSAGGAPWARGGRESTRSAPPSCSKLWSQDRW